MTPAPWPAMALFPRGSTLRATGVRPSPLELFAKLSREAAADRRNGKQLPKQIDLEVSETGSTTKWMVVLRENHGKSGSRKPPFFVDFKWDFMGFFMEVD